MSDDIECDPVPGLPEHLPAGEALLWQGHPDFSSMARHCYHAYKVAFYFALVIAARVVWQMMANGLGLNEAVVSGLPVAALGLCGVGLLVLLAWLSSRTTIYSLTSRRVVMRYGIALPMTVNIPFNEISAADLKAYAGGSGDIALRTSGPLKLAYFNLWPNVRPWHLKDSQPALRSVPQVQVVAALFADHWGVLPASTPSAAYGTSNVTSFGDRQIAAA